MMVSTAETKIMDAEEFLRLAMLNADVDALDRLLSAELIFTTHLGQVISKQDDLDAHRSGMMAIDVLQPSEQRIRVHGDMAIVSVCN